MKVLLNFINAHLCRVAAVKLGEMVHILQCHAVNVYYQHGTQQVGRGALCVWGNGPYFQTQNKDKSKFTGLETKKSVGFLVTLFLGSASASVVLWYDGYVTMLVIQRLGLTGQDQIPPGSFKCLYF